MEDIASDEEQINTLAKNKDAGDANGSELSPELLDDIIERLIYHDKYPGYTINENKQGSNSNLPYILKEREIRILIQEAENVFKE